MKRLAALAVLLVLYVLRFDFWFWNSPDLCLGLPVGLSYHLAFCLLVSLCLAWVADWIIPTGSKAPSGRRHP